ncbi:hypothetical protein [Bdellovibrio sp. HCB337]|uniref:hypothetical protein n=1 Tax=Bdellovibrio sp. HCB337 TaxID=3394358 RepID=UPI0039A4989C
MSPNKLSIFSASMAVLMVLANPALSLATEKVFSDQNLVIRNLAQAGIQLNAKDVVPEIVDLGIQPTVLKITPARLQKLSYKEDQYILQITIGRITADQFSKLKALYGGYSQVPYDQNRSYDLIDFLPPAIQAVVNKTFTAEYYDTSRLIELEWDEKDPDAMDLWALQKSGISFFTNCWGTTMEVLKSLRTPRPESTFTLSWPARWTADDIFKAPEHSSKVKTRSVRIWDVLTISESNMLQHTAIILGKNLVFEKTDTTDNDAYRLSVRADVHGKYKTLFEGKAKTEYRRFGSRKDPIPTDTPAELSENVKKILLNVNPELPVDNVTVGCEVRFGGGCDVVFTEIGYLKLKIDSKTGRGYLTGDQKYMKRFTEL